MRFSKITAQYPPIRQWHKQRGMISMQLAAVLIPFIASLLFTMEMCRVIYLASSIDLVLAQSGNIASITTSESNYHPYFEREFTRRLQSWPLLSRNMPIDIRIDFCQGIDAISKKECDRNNSPDIPLALYQVKVHYTPLFFILPDTMTTRILSRKLVFILEYQRIKERDKQ